ncbi:hypothetical protein [Pantoea stewartii]|uniref:hypothetical protein n=1 Tax=Pantoea stewartii TaxID=66269 RepID=UPI00128EEBB7|nr:hypothetical protein [Pantoea stewartii]
MSKFRGENSAVFLMPGVKGGIENNQPAVDNRHEHTQFGLFQGSGNLLSGFFISTTSAREIFSFYHAGTLFMNGAEFWVRVTQKHNYRRLYQILGAGQPSYCLSRFCLLSMQYSIRAETACRAQEMKLGSTKS